MNENNIKSLRKKLLNTTSKSTYLNCLPSNNTKLDIFNFSIYNNFIDNLLKKINEKKSFKYSFNLNETFEGDDLKKQQNIHKKLKTIYKNYKETLNDKGFNNVYLGYPIIIRHDPKDLSKIIIAPLYLFEISIIPTNNFTKWKLIIEDNCNIKINHSLQHWQQNVSDPTINVACMNNFINDDLKFTETLKIIKQNLTANLNGFIKNKHKLTELFKDKKKYKSKTNNIEYTIQNSAVIANFNLSKDSIIKDFNTYINNNILNQQPQQTKAEQFSINELDPSQYNIIQKIRNNKNLIIQGPPGTGKSQVITGIISSAVAKNKKVLVICEKKVALDVIQDNLFNINKKLFENKIALITDSTKDRNNIVNIVRNINWQNYKNLNNNFKHNNYNELNKHINNYNTYINNVYQKNLFDLNLQDLIGVYLNLKSKYNIQNYIPKNLIQIKFNYNDLTLSKLENDLKNIKINFEELSNNIYYNDLNNYSFNYLIKDKIYNVLLELKKLDYKYKKYIINEKINKIKKNINEINIFLNVIIDYNNNIKTFSLHDIKTYQKYKNNKILNWIYKKINSNYNNYEKFILKTFNNFNKFKIYKNFKTKLNLNKNDLNINNIQIEINQLYNNYKNELNELNNVITTYNNLSLFYNNNAFYSKILNECYFKLILEKSQILNTFKKDYIKQCKNVDSLIIKIENFYNEYNNNDIFKFETTFNNIYNTNLNITDLIWLNNNNNWKDEIVLYLIHNKINNTNNTNVALNHHIILNNIKNSIANIPQKIEYNIEYNYNLLLTRAYNKFNNNNQYTIKQLYIKRSSKKNTRLSLKQIISKDVNLFTTIFPIILTTPTNSSNLFESLYEYFDYVIFDEASQLKLEDTYTSILKGKKIIIAGDEHQMPPSDFFTKKMYDNDEIDNINEIIEQNEINSESLLDYAINNKNFETTYLDYHYRSKYQKLINFSKYAFYNRLIIVPVDKTKFNIDHPIIYENVNGLYENNINKREAEYIINFIKNIKIYDNNIPEVGIVTLNLKQQNLIYDLIYEKLETDDDFKIIFNKLKTNNFFIKNLENIQGDECDILIISTTFGVNSENKFLQHFGPINEKEKGYKLLNVLITRAKYQIVLVTSIPDNYINTYESELNTNGNTGKGLFYTYLAYAKACYNENTMKITNILNILKNNNENKNSNLNNINMFDFNKAESPFEIEVIQYLLKNFNKNEIILQYEEAGFRLDILIKPIDYPNLKIAVECDGATYHSGYEAHLNDIHRQKILENLGYKFVRIWSTDWFSNPEKEYEKIINDINKIKKSFNYNKNLVE